MKFVIVLACLLAVAVASDVVVVKELNEVNPDSASSVLETSDGTVIIQDAKLKDPHTLSVTGSYEYISKEGKPVKVTYVADELGYRPKVVLP